MRPLTEDEIKTLFQKLATYIGSNLKQLIDRPSDPHVFRLHRDRVYYVSEAILRMATSIKREHLMSLGVCFGKFSKTGKFRLHVTALDYLAKYAKYKVWVKPNGEMPFLYGNHVVKAHLGRITEDTPEHQGVVIYNMADVPVGFGVTARSTIDTRKLDPTAIIVFNQADIGEYLRDETLPARYCASKTSRVNQTRVAFFCFTTLFYDFLTMHAVLSVVLLGLAAGSASAHAHDGHHSHRLRNLPRNTGRTAEKEAELHRLFKRQSTNYPTADVPGPTPLSAWVQAYQRARQAGLIPNFANSVNRGGTPTYPASVNGQDNRVVCSWTLTNCNATTDIVNAPDGMIGISFDDGPQPAGTPLYRFLQSNNIPSTHFMIGSRILDNPTLFRSAINIGGHIAVHTWSHPLMTTMTDAQVLGELGWCMQIIYDNTGGLLPQFWRPPYGDVDNRVRAIAQQVFGLTTVIWNKDTDDWCLNDDGTNACRGNAAAPTTDAQLAQELTTFLNGPKSPGLIILEHEHKQRAVNGFINVAWPLIQSQGWKFNNIPSLFNLQYYSNAASNNATVQSMAVAVNAVTSAVPLRGAAAPAPGVASGIPTGARTLTVSTVVSPSIPSASLASMSAALLAAQANANAPSDAAAPLSIGAKVGIAVGGVVGAALLLLLVACLLVRCRRNKKQSRGGPNVTTHPYDNMLESKSSLKLDEKDVSPTKVSPVLLYAHPAPSAAGRKSTMSLYSQQDPSEAALDAYFRNDPAPRRPERTASRVTRPTTQRFHLPTSAVKAGAPYSTPKTDDNMEWL